MKNIIDMKQFGFTTLIEYLMKGLLAAVVLFACWPVNSSAAASKAANLCTKTSEDTLASCKDGTKSDYFLAIGKCDNLATPAGRKACRQQASKDMNSGDKLCKEQFDARQDICKGLGKAPYNPVINPADFVTVIDNPFFPLKPGTTNIYEGKTEKGNEHDEFHVTSDTKVILGVTCVVVRDTVTVDGNLDEDTRDWYAQDKNGNVWYFGENALEYQGSLIVGFGGSWIAGENGAKPGIAMEAHPKVGDLYRQEFALSVAEDMGEVLSLSESTTVQAGSFSNCLMTKDFSPVEPDAIEHKLYATGIGNVQIIDTVTGNHTDLVKIITE